MPIDVSVDHQGNLYIADVDRSVVRRVDRGGVITTVAGTGAYGYAGDGGSPLQAQFADLLSIDIAADGTLYLADALNNRIRAFNAFLPIGELSPSTVAFRIINNTGRRLNKIDADYDGDGNVDTTVFSENAPLQYRYPAPGVYTARFMVTDEAGAVYNASYVVVVTDGATSDTLLRGVYQTLLERLRTGNISGALNTITGGMRPKYEAVFNALQSNLVTVVEQLGTLQAGAIGDDLAEYVLLRTHPDGTARAFLIYFIRSEDGVWRIDGM